MPLPCPPPDVQALLSRSLRLIDTYDPPDLLALQLRSVAGLRWLPPGPWLTQVCKCGGDLMRGRGGPAEPRHPSQGV